MAHQYDMNVDYAVLCQVESKLKSIRENLTESTDCMVYALRSAGNYLSGEQFGKACETTLLCADSARKSVENIDQLISYIGALKCSFESYSRCGYGRR